jgi:hypothetical protein
VCVPLRSALRAYGPFYLCLSLACSLLLLLQRVYAYMYVCVHATGHRVSRPRGTGSVGNSVGEGVM